MSIGIGNEHEVFPFQVVLGANEVLRVMADGQFVWNPDADRMIEEGDFSFSPALPHILRALRKREWVGLMRGVRVEGDTVIISVKGGNDAARELCGALIKEMEA